MKKFKKAISLMLVLTIALAMASACGGGGGGGAPVAPSAPSSPAASPAATPAAPNPDAPPPEGDDVRFADTMDIIVDNNNIATINFWSPAGNNTATWWAYNLIYDPLVEFAGESPTGGNEYNPRLALSWDTDDWQTITMQLRDDVYFHNGEKFTAEDVVWTVTTSREYPGTLGFDRWRDVETVTALDTYTVEFVLRSVNADFFFDVSAPAGGILNRKAMEDNPETGTWIGTGAYQVAEFATNDYVVMERNDNYWLDPPITRVLTLRFVPEVSTRLMMLQNAESDVCFSISPTDLPTLEDDTENFVIYPYYPTVGSFVGFNKNDPVVNDINFKMAVASALDRTEIALIARDRYAVPDTEGTFWGRDMEFRNRDIPIVPYDLDKAREYLEASPYNGEVIELATAIATNIAASSVVQAQLARIGLTVEINQMDSPSLASYLTYSDNQSQMILFIAPFNVSSTSARGIFYPNGGQNRTSFNTPAVSEMLDQASSIIDINERRDHFFRMQEVIAEDPPGFNLYWLINAASCVRGVAGIRFIYGDNVDMRYIYKVLD